MFLLKNALKNVMKNKGRNSIIALIMLVMIVTTVIAMGINTTTRQSVENYKEQFGSEVYIVPDADKLSGSEEYALPTIGSSLYYAFADSDLLYKYQLIGRTRGMVKDVTPVDNNSNSANQNILGDENGEGPSFTIYGYSDISASKEFESGERTIIKGEMFSSDRECVISSALAELNDLDVGDSIEVAYRELGITSRNAYTSLKITGIYFDSTEEYGEMPFQVVYLNRRNEVITSMDTLQNISQNDPIYMDGSFYLKNPDMLADFEQELRNKGLSSIYKVSTDAESYNQIVGPVEGISSVTVILLIVILALGSITLLLLNSLSVRERKYEIGVLRAIGMKKKKVILMFLIESFILTIIALIMGILIGGAVSQPILNMLLESQLTTDVVEIANISVQINGVVLAFVSMVAVVIALISSLVGISFIVKYEPNQILRERG